MNNCLFNNIILILNYKNVSNFYLIISFQSEYKYLKRRLINYLFQRFILYDKNFISK